MRQGIIYKYTNRVTGECYIGQTVNPRSRMMSHVVHGHTSKFSKAVAELGFDAFDYEVLHNAPQDRLNRLEAEAITAYDSVNNGYNCNYGFGAFRKSNIAKPTKAAPSVHTQTRSEKAVMQLAIRRAREILKGKYK